MKNVMPQPMHDNSLFETLCILLVLKNKQIDHTHIVFFTKKITIG
jgi:predicted ATPase